MREVQAVRDDSVDCSPEVAAVGLMGAEEGGADSRVGVLVVKPWVGGGGGLAPWVQAGTPRPKMTGATTIRTRRVSEVFMTDPSGVLG
jgi:hypothetical protein